jgi:hypothetical protein
MGQKRRWTEKDRDKVIRMVEQGKSRKELCKALRTSMSSLDREFRELLNGRGHGSGPTPRKFTEGERASALAFASYGVPQREIADVLGCSLKVLLQNFGTDMRSMPTKANAAVARSLYRKATTDGDVNAQKYWLKNRAVGWEDSVKVEGDLSVHGGIAIDHSVGLANIASRLSPEGRSALRIVLMELQSDEDAIDVGETELIGATAAT